MAGNPRGFEYSDGVVLTNLKNLGPKIARLVVATTEFHSSRGEARMRKEARWTDRTTNARNGLHTATLHEDGRSTIVFAHGVPYGIWLEVRFAGRYAIIMPSVQAEGRAVMQTLSKGMAKLK